MQSATACWWLLTWLLGTGCPAGNVAPTASSTLWYEHVDAEQQRSGWSRIGLSVVNWKGAPHVLQLEEHQKPDFTTFAKVEAYYNLNGQLLYVRTEDFRHDSLVEQFFDSPQSKDRKIRVRIKFEDGTTKEIKLAWKPGTVTSEGLFNHYRNQLGSGLPLEEKLHVFVAPFLLALQGTVFSDSLSLAKMDSKLVGTESIDTINGPVNALHYKLKPSSALISAVSGERGVIDMWVDQQPPHLIYWFKQAGVLHRLKRLEHNAKISGDNLK